MLVDLHMPRAFRPCHALLLVVALGLAVPAFPAPVVEQMRIHAGPDYTRVVFDLSSPVDYALLTLSGPDRIAVDLAGAEMRFDTDDLLLDETPLAAVRTGSRADGIRVVLDLRRKLEARRHFPLDPVAPYGHRLVIDLFETVRTAPARRDPAAGAMRDIIVAVDAGHGGEDPGAIGAGGVREKDVVLAIARRLERMLDQEPGFQGVLIRDGDYYVPLRDRTMLARRHRADMLVSVHADAFKSPSARGASVYAISERGATSETARWLAEKENRSDLIGGVGPLSLDDKDDLLAQVLLDMSMTASLTASLDAGSEVLGSLGRVTRLHSEQVHQAGFVVLKSPDIPSILVETGYISNPREARLLATGDHQTSIARSIFQGVTRHLAKDPPPDTLIAYWRDHPGEQRRYVIEKGDTLSEIAQRFGVRTSVLRRANNLAGDVIRVGQEIVIPAS